MELTRTIKKKAMILDVLDIGKLYHVVIYSEEELVREFKGFLLERDEEKFTFAVYSGSKNNGVINDVIDYDWLWASDFEDGLSVDVIEL